MSFKADIAFGNKQEDLIKPVLERYFNINLEKTPHSARFDYVGENMYIELKSRRNTKLKYPTTIVKESKFNVGKELQSQGNRVIYVFNFTDILSFIEPKEETFLVKEGGRRDRGRPEISNYVYFPVNDLTDIII